MNWQEARANSLQKLEPISKKLSNCYELSLLCSNEFDRDYTNEISNLKNKVEKQIESLRKGEFHIAVVGLEKAGKSTLLNAFLNVDILPNDPERCTYTTTEIRAVRNISDQKVEIEFKDINDFISDKNGIEDICKNFTGSEEDKKKYSNDLEETKKYESKIRDCINNAFRENSKGVKTIPFDNIKDIKNTIKPYIEGEKININGKELKDTSKPRAVKKITLYTTELLGENELIMHDVPGWDSPVVLHRDLAKNKLSQADAILFVTNLSDRVSLKEGEESMMEIASTEDPDIKVKDKLFVFLNKADNFLKASALNENYQKALRIWTEDKKFCTKERVLVGSAYTYLVKIDEISDTIKEKDGKTKEKVTFNHLEELNRQLIDLDTINKLNKIDDGIDDLRKKLEIYLNNERSQILSKRSENILKQSNSLFKDFISQVELKHPEKDIQNLEDDLNESNELLIKKWWILEWKKIKENFAKWYYEEIIPQKGIDDKLGENLKLKILQEEFNKKLDELAKSWVLSNEEFDNLYRAKTGFATQPQKAHIEIREEILNKAYTEFEEVSYSISKVTEEVIEEILNWIHKELFYIKKCRNLVEEKTTKQEKIIEFGTYALLNRFSKPAFEVFLRNPRGTSDRKNLVEYFKNDIQILESFYKGKKSNYNLNKYLEIGLWIASNSPDPIISTTSKTIKNGMDLLNNRPLNIKDASKQESTYNVASNLDEIKKEITEDINSLIDYLKNSVFYASGITNFCYQEFNKIKEAFYSIEDKDRLFEVFVKRELLNGRIPEHIGIIKKTENDILIKKQIITLKLEL